MLVPDSLYWPGMGVVAGLALVFVIGVLMNAWLFRAFLEWCERLLERIPLVKTLYGAVRDLMGFFSGSDKKAMSKAVVVAVGNTSLRFIGFITREDFGDLPTGIGGDDAVAVYLPMSYQMGGFTTMVATRYGVSSQQSMSDGVAIPPGSDDMVAIATIAFPSTTIRLPSDYPAITS